ncbi:MAG: PQQ-dependent sugar dehydrogenase [Chloroflexota bacterium]
MAIRGRLLPVVALVSMLLLACQSADAASPRPSGEATGIRAAAKPAEKPFDAAQAAKPAGGESGRAAAKPAEPRSKDAAAKPSTTARQADGNPPRISLQALPFGFKQPLFLTHAGDGSGRRFVVERGGTIRVIQGDQLLPTPFLDISSRITTSGTEQGLLGLAFHPHFAENGRFFVGYTDRQGKDTVERYQVSADPNVADPSTGVKLLSIDDPAPNHNGGMVLFGPDGKLWIGFGDGGAAGDRFQNGQNKQTLLGKMLRLDADSGEPYGIPADNPYVGSSEYRPEIWAMGLRNPWRYSFDRATGDLWIGDVGQNAYEEIDRVPAGSTGGLNFGWPITEGTHCYPVSAQCDTSAYTQPVVDYGRDGGCSVTGGYVYRGPSFPTLQGLYFFGDFCTGKVWSLDRPDGGSWRMTEQLQQPIQISSFGEDEAGDLYVTTFSGGSDGHKVYQVVAQ